MADGDVTKTSIILHLQDAGTQKGKMIISGVAPTVTLAKAFYAAEGYCAVTGASMVQELECAAVAGSGSGLVNSVDKKLTVYYKNSTTNKRGSFQIPGYKEPDASFQQGERGTRLKPAEGQALVDAYVTAGAITDTLVFVRGIPTTRI